MRIATLADGVFAIVLTLLVLDIKAPQASSEAELLSQLLALWPKLFSYIISFAILGIFWFGHHMEFHYIRRLISVPISLILYALIPILYIRPPREDRYLTFLPRQRISRDDAAPKT
jgi:uncharacterized membrane protein